MSLLEETLDELTQDAYLRIAASYMHRPRPNGVRNIGGRIECLYRHYNGFVNFWSGSTYGGAERTVYVQGADGRIKQQEYWDEWRPVVSRAPRPLQGTFTRWWLRQVGKLTEIRNRITAAANVLRYGIPDEW